MTAQPKTDERMFVSVVEETTRISDEERAALLASLEESRADVARGNYIELTLGSLRAELDLILDHDLTDEEIDLELRNQGAIHRA